MWELSTKSARGRISLRRFSLMATAMLMAMFAITSLLAPKALAADATRSGDTLSYDNRTFNLMSNAQRPSGIAADVTGYASVDEANHKAYYVLTTGDAAKATTGQYVVYDFTPPSNFSNSSPPVTVSIADTAATQTTTTGSGDGSSCNSQVLQGIGWILCPVVNFLASGMDHLFDILTGFLVVQPAKATDDNSLFKMWGIVRSIANICFVILFLVVIYSQVTSIGISNYGIKKIMPRLIIAAVLVNISFWVCALAIDISNVLGYGIHSLFMNVFDSLNTSGAYQNLTWSNVAVSILSGTAVTALGAFGIYGALVNLPGLLIAFIPTLVGVLLSVLVALLVISVRQALIVCLVIISPLAFVAYLLPNTEKYFTKWRELFMTLLLVYPIFAVVFGGSQLAGMAIIQSAGGALNLIILGMAVQVAPVVVTPLLIKVSGSLVGKIAALANNPRQAIMGKTRTWSEGHAAERKARVLADANRNGRLVRLSRKLNDYNTEHEQSRKEYEAANEHRFAGTTRGARVERLRRVNANTAKQVGIEHDRRFRSLEIQSRNLDTEKGEVETEMMGTSEGRNLRQRQMNLESYKTETENAFGRDARGHQARERQEHANIDKVNVDNLFNGTPTGLAIDRARRIAESSKKTIDNQHETNWNNAVRTSPDLLKQDLALTESQAQAELSKGKLDTMHAEIVAEGDQVEHILNLRGVDNATRSGMLKIARNIKAVSNETTFTSKSKAQADRKVAENIAQILADNTLMIDGKNVVQYAAGVMREVGERSVVAQAKTERSKFTIDDVRNIESTLDYDISSSPDKLHKLFNSATTDAERVAYTSIMAKRGAPGANKLREMAREMDSRFQRGLLSQSDLNDYKELVLAQNSNIMGLGKDLEFFFTNAAFNGDFADPSVAGKVKTFDEIANDAGTWANLSADSFSRMNIVNQMHGLKILAHKHPAKYASLVENLKRSPSAMANMKDDVVEAINKSADDPYWQGGVYNTPSRSELTGFEQHTLFEPEITTFTARPDYPSKTSDDWRDTYQRTRQSTQRRLDEAKQRGIDYENLP